MSFSMTTIIGRMVRDGEMKVVGDGIEKCRFTVAVDGKKDKKGEKKTVFYVCDAWRQQGAFVNKYFHKGDGICVSGSMETYQTENNGVKITWWVLNAEHVDFLPSSKSSSHSGAPVVPEGYTEVEPEEDPF